MHRIFLDGRLVAESPVIDSMTEVCRTYKARFIGSEAKGHDTNYFLESFCQLPSIVYNFPRETGD